MQYYTLSESCAIHYGALWDGRSANLLGPGTLYAGAGVLSTTLPKASVETLDFSAFTVMPAFIDCHVHLAFTAESGKSTTAHMESFLSAGVAAVREGGSRAGGLFSDERLRIANCSRAICKTGHYGSNLGTAVSGLQEAVAEINRMASLGIQHIKIIASGIFSFSQYGKTGPLPFAPAELKAMTRHAQSLGLSVMAHASGDDAVQSCIAAGVDSIEHGYFMEEKTLKELAAHNIAWVPTLIPVAVHLDNPTLCGALTVTQQDIIRRSLERQMRLVGLGAALGVRIGAGSDAGAAGVPHGRSLFWEMDLLRRSGLTPFQALQSATATAAEICGFHQLGVLEPGKMAVLLAVNGNPLQEPATLLEPAALITPHRKQANGETI